MPLTTQEDWKAAEDWLDAPVFATLPEAFARHRIQALEAAAKVAEELGGNRVERNGDGSLRSYDMDSKHGRGDATLNAMRVRAQSIAAAIRTLYGAEPDKDGEA